MDARRSSLFSKVDLDGVPHIGPDDQGTYFLIGLGDGKLEPLPGLPLDARGVLLQHIQHAVGVVVSEFVVDDGKGDRFYIIDPELSGAWIS